MNIPENFDRWMFDYKEGNLSGAELQEFENFLIQNPEFEIEADAWENAFIRNEEFVYADAYKLEKHNRFAMSRWAAAALILLLVGASTTFVLTSGDDHLVANFDGSELDGTGSESAHFNNIQAQEVNFGTEEKMESNTSSDLTTKNNTTYSSTAENSAHLSSNSLFAQSNVFNSTASSSSVGRTNGNQRNNRTESMTVASNDIQSVSFASEENKIKKSNELSLRLDLSQVSFNQEVNKYEIGVNSSKYLDNPSGRNLKFDVSRKGSVNYNSLRARLKRTYRKIEKALGYPVGLKNLRNPEIGLPEAALLSNNPGFAGGSLTPRFELNYRNQWFGSDMNSQIMNISYDNYSYNLRGGYGVMVTAKDFGLGGYDDVSVNLFYSPKIVIGKNFVLEPAVKLTLGSVSANAEQMESMTSLEINRGRTIGMTGAKIANGNSRTFYKDFGLGFMLNSEWFYAGFSADNLSGHYENVFAADGGVPSKAPTHLSAIVGSDYENYGKTMTISPFVAYQKYDQRNEVWAGFNYRLNWLTIGGAISSNKDFTASGGVKFDRFRLIYRYDRTQSQTLTEPVGSHSFGVRINGKATSKPRLRN